MFRHLIVALVCAFVVFPFTSPFVSPFVSPFISPEVHAQEPDGEDYNLSMSGALINDWCTRNWQDTDYITVHACNYSLAQRYTLEVSEAEFASCAVANGGDIVKIADCLFARFGEWIAEQDI